MPKKRIRRADRTQPAIDKYRQESGDMLLAADLVDALKHFTVAEAEKIPEVRMVLGRLTEMTADRQRIADYLNVVPYGNRQPIAEEMGRQHETHLQHLYSRLYNGIVKVHRRLVRREYRAIRREIAALKSALLLTTLNPFAALESAIVQEVRAFLSTQIGYMAPLRDVYRHLAYRIMTPIPGRDTPGKYQYLVDLFNHVECFRMVEGLLVAMDDGNLTGDEDRYGQGLGTKKALQRAIRNLDTAVDGAAPKVP